MHQADTAILLFSRSLEEEFKAKSFGLTSQRFKRFYNALLRKIRRTLKSTTLPVFEIDSNLQQGNSFGERLVNAIRQVQQQGFDKILILGNDTLELNASLLHQAISDLRQGKNTLGKDVHGGCYLIGLQTKSTDLEALQHVHWQSGQVYDQVSTLLGVTTTLPELTDLNGKKDLRLLIGSALLPKAYLIQLLQWLFPHKESHTQRSLSSWARIHRQLVLRGPPHLV